MNKKVKSTVSGAADPLTQEVPALRTLAEAQLRGASVRATKVRIKVLASLLGANRAFSHQDVQDAFVELDRVTLYRALDCLIDAGLAHRIAGDDRIFRYSAGTDLADRQTASPAEPRQRQHQHGHFKCTRCARIFCLEKNGAAEVAQEDAAAVAKRQLALRRRLQTELQRTLGEGFRSHDIELTIKGWCADCGH
jgi:Fur family transcriptional regulator, ferric uptake regulator